MQNLHSAELRQVQEQYLDTASILDLADPENATIVDSDEYRRRSTSAWQAKLASAPTARDNRRTIIRDWLDQVYDADHAIYLFRLFKLRIGAYRGTSYALMSRAAYDEFGAVELPVPVTAHIPSGYANSELLEVLEPVRAGGRI